MTAVSSGYEPGTILFCTRCGILGDEADVFPHNGQRAPFPECLDSVVVASEEQAVDSGFKPGSGEVIHVLLGSQELSADEPTETDALAEAIQDAEVEVPKAAQRRNVAAKPDGSLHRLRTQVPDGRKELGLVNPAPGGAHVVRPDPLRVSVTSKVSLETLGIFQVFRNDERIGFDGTISDFLDQAPQALAILMGYDGMFLVKRKRLIEQMLEEATV